MGFAVFSCIALTDDANPVDDPAIEPPAGWIGSYPGRRYGYRWSWSPCWWCRFLMRFGLLHLQIRP